MAGTAMRLDFSSIPLQTRAFSEAPMTFADPSAKNFLSAIMNLAAIETGDRAARERWQRKQLENLLAHAARRSAFWKKRIGAGKIDGISLSDLPVQTRADVVEQFESEGSLMPADGPVPIKKHSTSGSSGKPLQFFITEANSTYNVERSAAQHFMEGRDLSLNRTRMRPDITVKNQGFVVQRSNTWIRPLANMIRTGINKHIDYFHPDFEALCKELERDSIGYLVTQPRVIETMLQYVEPDFFRRAGTAMVIPLAEALAPELRNAFLSLSIPVRANYSSEEVGMIAVECESIPEMFHVATSNVIVETTGNEPVRLTGRKAGRVLLTHLHSYATPFIRYDVGDIATLEQECPCGHDGPALSSIHGRTKALLKHSDGKLSIFYLRGKEMSAIARFDEYRIRQVDIGNIVVEIGGRTTLAPEETAAFIALIRDHAGDEFEIQINPVAEIDWGRGAKRLGFHNEIL
jgi:phenylacetate-CoA ligase